MLGINLITLNFAIYFFKGWHTRQHIWEAWGTPTMIIKCIYHKNCWDQCLRTRWTPRTPTPAALTGCWGRLVPTPLFRALTPWSCWNLSCWAPFPVAAGDSSRCQRWSRACPCWALSRGISGGTLFSWAGDREAVSTAATPHCSTPRHCCHSTLQHSQGSARYF